MGNAEELVKIYRECIKELENIGLNFEDKEINIKLSNRLIKRYGCCKPELPDERYKKIKRKGFKFIIKYDNYKKYTIEVSNWVLDLNEDIIKNTIMHELIHCMPYCTNHGTEFRKYANIINDKLGYNISRLGNKKEDFEKSNKEYKEDNDYKYKIQCTQCGQIYYRQRLNKNFMKRYRCGICRGKLKLI